MAVEKKRKTISKRLRFEVFKRDSFSCQYCGATPPKVILHIDHIIPIKEGGRNDQDNLVTACEPCNLGKGAVPLEVFSPSLAQKAREIQEREEQLRGFQEIMEAKRQRLDSECWEIVSSLFPDSESIRRDWFQSIKRFIERLGFYPVLEAAEEAISNITWRESGRFRYFCAICWRLVKESE